MGLPGLRPRCLATLQSCLEALGKILVAFSNFQRLLRLLGCGFLSSSSKVAMLHLSDTISVLTFLCEHSWEMSLFFEGFIWLDLR